MNDKELRKQHKPLWKLWVENKFGFPDSEHGPVPQKGKNYILSVVSDSRRCFVVIEYNDGWESDDINGKQVEISIQSKEIMSYKGDEISESEFFSLLMDIVKIYSTEDLENELIICNRTNGPGQTIFDMMRIEARESELENIRFFPTSRRSKANEELFTRTGTGWKMSVAHEKDCFDAMRTAQEQQYFSLATNNSKNAFRATSIDDKERKDNIEPFEYCWLMLSFIRFSTMNLF